MTTYETVDLTSGSRSARDRVLEVAAQLFYAQGFHAVGVDLVVARSGVAKTTLYRHFPSKDDLIVAYLGQAHEAFHRWFEAAAGGPGSPADRLVQLFESLGQLTTKSACLGCAFQVAAAEFPERGHPAHVLALAHKEAVRVRLRDLAAGATARDPQALADGLFLLMDGALAAARMYGPASPAACVGGVARMLVAGATDSDPAHTY